MSDAPATTSTRRERAAIGLVRAISGGLVFLGTVGLLRTGADDFGSGSTKDLEGLTVHPLTALVWLVIGLVGVAMSVAPARARLFLIGVGSLLVLWGLVAILTGGEASTFFTDDPPVVALHLVAGAAALLVALAPTPRFLERAFARGAP
jgi:hypothetical protein